MATISASDAGGQNVLAMLNMIAISELGAALIAESDQGYNCIVGSTPDNPDLFHSYADHPRKHVFIPNLNIWSTAAGRYQIIERYFDAYKAMLELPDFGKMSQDRIAVQMITECHAVSMLATGNITGAIAACSSRWASLSGAGYGQHEQKIDWLVAQYQSAGGTLTS